MNGEPIHVEAHPPERRQRRSMVLACGGCGCCCCCCCCLHYVGAVVGMAVGTAPATALAPRRIGSVLALSWAYASLVTVLLFLSWLGLGGGFDSIFFYLVAAPATPLISGPLTMGTLALSGGRDQGRAIGAAAVIAGLSVAGALLGWAVMYGLWLYLQL